jgi:hypothetical protein
MENALAEAKQLTVDAETIKAVMASRPAPGAAIATALARVQALLSSVGKDREVDVKSEKGKYSFKYATLAAIWDVIRAPCAEHGLAIVQFPSVNVAAGLVTVETRLMHVSGEWLSSVCELPIVRKDPQGIGSIITYARRYGLSAMLGVVSADEDDDGAAGSPHGGGGMPWEPPARAPAPTSSSRPTPPKAAPTAAKPSGPPISLAELEQNFDSCSTKSEVLKVAARAKAADLTPPEREKLLGSYKRALERCGELQREAR